MCMRTLVVPIAIMLAGCSSIQVDPDPAPVELPTGVWTSVADWEISNCDASIIYFFVEPREAQALIPEDWTPTDASTVFGDMPTAIGRGLIEVRAMQCHEGPGGEYQLGSLAVVVENPPVKEPQGSALDLFVIDQWSATIQHIMAVEQMGGETHTADEVVVELTSYADTYVHASGSFAGDGGEMGWIGSAGASATTSGTFRYWHGVAGFVEYSYDTPISIGETALCEANTAIDQVIGSDCTRVPSVLISAPNFDSPVRVEMLP